MTSLAVIRELVADMLPFLSHQSFSERILFGNIKVDTGGSTLLPEVEELGEGIIGELIEPNDPIGVSRCGECVAIGDLGADDVDSSFAVVDKAVSVGVYRPDSLDGRTDESK